VRAVVPVAVPEHDRLGEEAVRADRPGGLEQVGGPGGTQGVRTPHRLPYLRGAQRGQLVHHRVGPHAPYGGEQALAVHHVGHHGLGAAVAQPVGVGLAAADADNLVTSGDELAGEGRTDGARGAGEQYSHGFGPFLRVSPLWTRAPVGRVTTWWCVTPRSRGNPWWLVPGNGLVCRTLVLAP